MRHRIGDFAQALHQPLDAVQHAVEIFRQHVELVARRRSRGTRRVRSPAMISPLVRLMASSRCSMLRLIKAPPAEPEQQDQHHRPGQGGGEHALGQIAVMHVLGHQEIEVARQRERRGRGRGAFPACRSPAAHSRTRPCCRRSSEICGQESRLPATDDAAHRRADRAPGPGCERAAAHRLHQAAQAEMLILLRQAGDLGLDDLVGLRVQGAARVPIGEEQQRRHRNGEQQHIDKNDAKSLGP